MAVNSDELKKAMGILGISDIHIDREEAKKIYKKLLLKWHPDSCPSGDERLYNEICTRINAAYEIIEKAYEEGLMGPNAKVAEESYSYKSSSSDVKAYSGDRSNDSDKQSTGSSSQASTSDNDKNQYAKFDDYDSPSGWDIIYYRKRWLNIAFLSVCLMYIINAIIKSPQTDIYIEKFVINLISMLGAYYGIYWFCKALFAECGFLFSGIFAGLIYKGITFITMFIYNKFGVAYEWFAMLLFIVAFFVAEYFIHIKKILLTFDWKIRASKYTKFFSCFMLLEYAIMLAFGIYSVVLVHKYMEIRNVIIPSWY